MLSSARIKSINLRMVVHTATHSAIIIDYYFLRIYSESTTLKIVVPESENLKISGDVTNAYTYIHCVYVYFKCIFTFNKFCMHVWVSTLA